MVRVIGRLLTLADHAMSDGPAEIDDVERAIRRANAAPHHTTTACLDDGDVAAFVDGLTSSDVRDRAIVHLAECAICRAAFVDLTAALASQDIAASRAQLNDDGETQALRAPRAATRGLNRRVLTFTGVAAAALLFMLFKVPTSPTESLPTMRDDAAAIIAPAAVSPRGDAGSSGVFRWRRIDGADLYRVTVFAVDGVVVWEGESPDTTLPMPPAPTLQRGSTYLWRVQARSAFNRWASSDLVEFRVNGAPGQ